AAGARSWRPGRISNDYYPRGPRLFDRPPGCPRAAPDVRLDAASPCIHIGTGVHEREDGRSRLYSPGPPPRANRGLSAPGFQALGPGMPDAKCLTLMPDV